MVKKIGDNMKKQLITETHPRYHGEKSNGCVLVKARREEVYRGHYIDIYVCLTHNKECCRCGWEWGFHNGEDSSKLEDKIL